MGSDGPMFFMRRAGQTQLRFLATLAAPLYGASADEQEVGLRSADHLDLIELVTEIEEALRPGRC
jgi:hypothetical protein